MSAAAASKQQDHPKEPAAVAAKDSKPTGIGKKPTS